MKGFKEREREKCVEEKEEAMRKDRGQGEEEEVSSVEERRELATGTPEQGACPALSQRVII